MPTEPSTSFDLQGLMRQKRPKPLVRLPKKAYLTLCIAIDVVITAVITTSDSLYLANLLLTWRKL